MTESAGPKQNGCGRVPSHAEVVTVFQKHLESYGKTRGEQAQVLRNSEASVKLQYSGRVAFELLQNALDRAKEHIWVALLDEADAGASLVVANDGAAVTLDPDFDYEAPPSRERRADLNALLSLHSSNKSADESMGNKGIGFRSVFGVAERVQVWSRCRDGAGWWGVEMHWPAGRSLWLERAQAYAPARRAVEQCWGNATPPIVANLDDTERASFALPLPLFAEGPPEALAKAPMSDILVTAVVVPLRPGVRKDVESHLAELMGARLHFVGLRPERRSIMVSIQLPGKERCVLRTWPVMGDRQDWSVVHWRSPALAPLAKLAEHPIAEPGVALAWPPRPDRSGTADEASIERIAGQTPVFNYLPTLLKSDFAVDLHGDFQVKADRTSMDLGENVVGRYNHKLIEAAADLQLWAALTCLGAQNHAAAQRPWKIIRSCPADGMPSLGFRDDLWFLLTPREQGFGALVGELGVLLFDRDHQPWKTECHTRWAELAQAFFIHPEALGKNRQGLLPCGVFQEFWDASAAWLDRLTGCRRHTPTWQQAASALCQALREAEVPCLPLTESIGLGSSALVPAVPLPDRLEKGSQVQKGSQVRSAFRVFLRRTEQRVIILPTALLKNKRAITAFPLGPFGQSESRPTGVVDFGRWEVLAELRQLPNDIGKFSGVSALDPDKSEAVRQQQELIRLAADLFTMELGTSHAPSKQPESFGLAWRADPSLGHSDPVRAAGRALATLFLPMTESLWAPARQLHRGQVHIETMGLPAEGGVDVEAFLDYLGVAPKPPSGVPPVLLVEKGSDGLIVPRELPPQLCAPGNDEIGQVSLATDESTRQDPTRLASALRDAWSQGAFARLIECENRPADGNTKSSTAITNTLRGLAWVPVGQAQWVIAPEGIQGARAVRPAQVVTQQPGKDRRAVVTYRLGGHAGEPTRLLLEALGALPALSSEHLRNQNGQAACEILKTLCDSYPEPFALPPDRLRNLLDVAQEAIEALMHQPPADLPHPPIPVHDASGRRDVPLNARRVRWVDDPDVDAWIAQDNAQQEIVRRFFPDLALASITLGSSVLSRHAQLGRRAVLAKEHVKGAENRRQDDSMARELAQRISEALPGLLALAQASRIMTPDATAVRKRWGNASAGRLVHVEDAWIEIALEGPVRRPAEFLKGSEGHVLLLTAPGGRSDDEDRETGQILFDTKADGTPPRLADFGNAVADLLLGNRSLGPLFAYALGTLGQPEGTTGADWRRLLEHEGASALVDGYRVILDPLTDDEQRGFRERVAAALAGAGARLSREDTPFDRLQRLRGDDLRPLDGECWPPDTKVHPIAEALDHAPWTDRERPFRPVATVEAENEFAWKGWLDDGWGRRLDAYALHQRRGHGHPDEQLQELHTRRQDWLKQNAFGLMKMACHEAAAQWLRHELAGVTDLTDDIAKNRIEETLRNFAPRYKPVTDLLAMTVLGWSAPSVSLTAPSQVEMAPATGDERDQANAIRSAIGDEAEQAVLPYIAVKTHEVLQRAQDAGEERLQNAWEVLKAAAPGSGKTRKAIEEARLSWMDERGPESLQKALHVSRIWGNAGFDFLGLEEKAGKPVAVRYETKGLPAGDGVVYIHLSNNERKVASRVRQACPDVPDDARYQGDWKLIAVKPDGQAVDLTSMVDDLIKHPDQVLGELLAKGMTPDGLLLRLNRRSDKQ